MLSSSNTHRIFADYILAHEFATSYGLPAVLLFTGPALRPKAARLSVFQN